MCFLPLGCLKAITTIGAVISIIISFALLGVTIYANMYKKKILDRASQGTLNTGLVFAYIGSIVFLLLGISGLYGSLKGGKDKKGNKCLLGLYSIGVIVFFFVFLAGIFLFFFGPKAIFYSSCNDGGSTSLNFQVYTESNNVYDKFCKADCKCYVDPKNTYLIDQLNANGFKNFDTTNSSLPVQYQQCQNYNATEEDKTALLLAALEEFLGCGGWCDSDKPKFLRFTNLNNCATKDCFDNQQSCYSSFKDFMETKGETLGITCIFACLICLLNVMTVCCICCHPKKTGKKKNFYARMIDTQN